MYELFMLFLALLILGTPLLALLAFLRSRKADYLALEVVALENRIAKLEASRAAATSGAPELGVAERAREPVVEKAPAPPERVRGPLVARADEIASREALRILLREQPPTPPIERRVEAPRAAVPARKAIDWEQWIGVHGAATAAGIAFALGFILLFREAIERGWATPSRRVVGGAVSGALCVAGALFARRKRLRHIPGALAGAGVVALYASSWSAHRLYDLVPFAVSFTGMVLVTVLCIALALSLRAQLVALLGLVGGFATPLLLDSDVDRPLSLFGYLLLLDVGLLVVAARRGWPALGLVGLGATFAYEVLWTILHVDGDDVPLALSIAGTFALVFAFAGAGLEGSKGRAVRAGGLLLPILLALHFGRSPDLAPDLWPTAVFVAVLVCGAAVVARRMDAAWLSTSSAGGVLAVVFTWFARAERTGATQVEFCVVSVGFALLFQAFAEWDRRRGRREALLLPPETLVASGFFSMALLAAGAELAPPRLGPWPLAATWVVLALLLARQALQAESRDPATGRTAPLLRFALFGGAIGTGTGLALWANYHGAAPDFPGATSYAVLVLGVAAIGFAAAAFAPRASRRIAWHAAGSVCVPLIAGLARAEAMVEVPLALGLFLVLSLAMALVAVPTRQGAWVLGAAVACALAQAAARRGIALAALHESAPTVLALSALAVLAFVALPFVVRFPDDGRFGGARACAFRAAALAPILWLSGLDEAARRTWEAIPDGLPPALLGCVALGALASAARRLDADDVARRVAVVWLAGSAAFLLAIAGPMQLDRHVFAVAAAATGFAFACLWKRLDHPGLKYLALAALFAASLGTAAFLADPSELARAPWPVFDWTGYAALLPGVLLVAAARIFGASEVERLRPFETVYVVKRPLVAVAAGIGGLLAIFTWINLEIFDHFGSGARVAIDFGYDPERDLALSIAWALYALVLLTLGMLRKVTALRWASLAFLVLSLGKVFLHDLGELEGLFRVASLCGLALSLLLVSVLYQRFVFRAASYPDQTTL